MKYRTAPAHSGAAGFTLIEIMVVVVIIGILAAMVVPNVIGRDDQARVTVAKKDLQAIGSALDTYKLENFICPSTEQGLQALIERPAGFPEARNWSQPYLRSKKIPEDPWGNPYGYVSTNTGFELFSLGADGQEGGEGFASDLYLSDL